MSRLLSHGNAVPELAVRSQNRKLRAGICIPVEVLRLPCDPVHGRPSVPSPGRSGGSQGGWRQCMADVSVHPDPGHHADG